MSSPHFPMPPSPAPSDKTITQKQYSRDEALEALMEYWAMIKQKPTKKSERELMSIRHNFINMNLDSKEDLYYYTLAGKYAPLKADNLGKIYFENCPDLPRDLTKWFEECAERRGCKKGDIKQCLKDVEIRWQSVKDGQNNKTEDSK